MYILVMGDGHMIISICINMNRIFNWFESLTGASWLIVITIYQ